jgi:hypothetical protein
LRFRALSLIPAHGAAVAKPVSSSTDILAACVLTGRIIGPCEPDVLPERNKLHVRKLVPESFGRPFTGRVVHEITSKEGLEHLT